MPLTFRHSVHKSARINTLLLYYNIEQFNQGIKFKKWLEENDVKMAEKNFTFGFALHFVKIKKNILLVSQRNFIYYKSLHVKIVKYFLDEKEKSKRYKSLGHPNVHFAENFTPRKGTNKWRNQLCE